MFIDPDFDRDSLSRIETLLRVHPIALQLFRGVLYDLQGQRLHELEINRGTGNTLTLDAATIGRLFMIPDGSVVSTLHVTADAEAPTGLDVSSRNMFVGSDEPNSVIVYQDEVGPAIWIEGMHIHQFMLGPHAPERLATIAFGMMAIEAYRLGFQQIQLYAAGRGPLNKTDPDAYIGYLVWPKFGFDADVVPVELHRFPEPAIMKALTVQDVRSIAPDWWEQHGSARVMVFDLAARSRSWRILLNYFYEILWEDLP